MEEALELSSDRLLMMMPDYQKHRRYCLHGIEVTVFEVRTAVERTDRHEIIIPQSCLTTVRSLFQSQFSTQCNLVLPLSISIIFSFH